MSKLKCSLWATVVVLGLGGCAKPYYVGLSSHTVAVGEHQDADVIWISDVSAHPGAIYRCGNSAQGPICQVAQVQQP